MDRWSSRGGKRQRRERVRRERVSRKKISRKKIKACEKVEKTFSQCFVAPDGRKVDPQKRRVQSHLGRWEIKNCTPLWREAHFEVKMHKHLSFGALLEAEMLKKCTASWREAHFEVTSVQNTPFSDHFWKLRCPIDFVLAPRAFKNSILDVTSRTDIAFNSDHSLISASCGWNWELVP